MSHIDLYQPWMPGHRTHPSRGALPQLSCITSEIDRARDGPKGLLGWVSRLLIHNSMCIGGMFDFEHELQLWPRVWHHSTGYVLWLVFMWRSHPSLSVISPLTWLSQLRIIWSSMDMFSLLFVWHVPMHSLAPIRTHLSPPSPLYVRPHTCVYMFVLGNLPSHKWTGKIPCWPMGVLFLSCFCVC